MAKLVRHLRQTMALMKKTSKASVSYQNEPRGGERCGQCALFVKPNGCALVMGHILPQGWCVEYEPKQ
jgi:hypothetical protein